MIVCRSPAEIERMRAANQLVAQVLAELAAMVAPGVTTADLDRAAEAKVARGGAPSRRSRATAGIPRRCARR